MNRSDGQWDEATVREYLHDRYGLDAAHLNTSWLTPLLTALGRSGASGNDMESAIVSAATVHESMFLRHAEHFAWLGQEWLPGLLARRGNAMGSRTIRVLSAACACGEEPYSVAAVLLPLLPDGWRLEIEAVDACEASVMAAERGTYSRWALRGVPAEVQNDWLRVDGHLVTIADRLRGPVRFRRHNLLDPLPSDWTFDLIVCRNMLIYFHPNAIRRTFGHLLAALRPDGALLLGPSDPRPPQDMPLRQHWNAGVAWYTRGTSGVAWRRGPSGVAWHRRGVSGIIEPAPRDGAGPVHATPIRLAPAADRGVAGGPAQTPLQRDPGHRTGAPAAAERWPTVRRPATRAATRAATAIPVRESGLWALTDEKAPTGDAQYQLARQLVRQGDNDLAMKVLQQLLCYAPLHVPSLVLAAMVAAESGHGDLAVENARKAAYLEPDSPYPVFVLGDALQRQGHHAQAETRYQWARRLLDTWSDDHALPFSEQLTARQLKELLDARPAQRIASGG